MNTLLRSALAATFALAASFPALADVQADAMQAIQPGKSQAAVLSALGAPEMRTRDLIDDSTRWFYRQAEGSLGNEPIWRVTFDAQGQVLTVERHDASVFNLSRFE